LWRVTRDDVVLPRRLFFRRFWVLVVLVISVNTTWHFLRAWLPLFLEKQHGYSAQERSWFFTAYYLSTDAGSLTAGFLTLSLARRGFAVHASRVLVFAACVVLTSLGFLVPYLAAGPLLIAVLLVVGFGSLGLFPNYYAFSQEITIQHQGKVTGALGCINWLAMAFLHELVGDSVKQTGSYGQGLALAAASPLLGLLVLWCFWNPRGGNHAATSGQPPG
jgi:ACS family hexuronate transporter-like MFS transporter